MHNAVGGATTGTLTLRQSAVAGSGGASALFGGGLAGSAVSALSLADSSATRLDAALSAVGGNGGDGADLGGPPELSPQRAGGAASATLTLVSSVAGGTVRGSAYAGGGNGGALLYGATGGQGGAALATVVITAQGAGDGASVAVGGHGAGGAPDGAARASTSVTSVTGVAVATARATGVDGLTDASAGAGDGARVATSASASGLATSVSQASYGAAAYTYSDIDPSAAVFSYGSAAAPQGATLAAGGSIGAGIQGASYAPAAAYTYTAVGQYSFNLLDRSTLMLDLLSFAATGASFDTFSLRVEGAGTLLFARSFTSLAEASGFFSGQVLNLGTAAAGLQQLTLTSSLSASAAGSFAFQYVLGAVPVTAVPEAQTWLLLLAGLGLVVLRVRRGTGAARA
jgi:hypothetical protein